MGNFRNTKTILIVVLVSSVPEKERESKDIPGMKSEAHTILRVTVIIRVA